MGTLNKARRTNMSSQTSNGTQVKNSIIKSIFHLFGNHKKDDMSEIIQRYYPVNHNDIQDRFLVNRDDIQNVCDKYIKKYSHHAILGAIITTLVGALVSAIISVLDPWQNTSFRICSVLAIILAVVWLIMFSKRSKSKDILNEIYNDSFNRADYTGIFLITRVLKSEVPGKNDIISIMTQNHSSSGTPFMVYQDLKECMVNDQLNLEEVKKKLADDVGIQPDAISISVKDDTFREIKRTSSPGNEKMIRYVYFETKIPEDLREKVEQKYEWKTLDSMFKDPQIMSRNADLLYNVKQHLNYGVQDSFYKDTDVIPIKIIWNITSKCNYNCDICATYRKDCKELDIDKKCRILMNLLSIGKDRIREIDFSGGDPLFDSDSWDIILSAQQSLGKEKVCVTTTGKGIEKVFTARREILHDLLTNCEITVDEVDEIDNACSTIRKQEGYNFENRDITKQKSNYISKLTVNVPILNCNAEDSYIKTLVSRIAGIQASIITVSLLRLMPSGKMSEPNKYPSDYNPIHFVSEFEKYASEHENLHLHKHCALKCFNSEQCSGSCNMLTNKIGIDNEGNVFACAWGGYINGNEDPSKNPFYLGNAYNDRLADILNNQKARQMKEKIRKSTSSCCRVFNYHHNLPNHNIYKDADPAQVIRKGATKE